MNIRKLIRKILSENYPVGAETDSNAPWNKSEPKYSLASTSDVNEFTTIGLFPGELAILSDISGNKYTFYFGNINRSEFEPYAEREIVNTEKGEDGSEHDYSDEWEIDNDVINRYVNDNLGHMTRGEGILSWEDGIDIVKIDNDLSSEILRVYRDIPSIQSALL